VNKRYFEQSRLVLRTLPLIRKYPHFCLKGGTALNFFVQDLPRLSIDIDLTYIPINNRTTALTEITTSMESLEKDIKKLFGKTFITEKRTRDGYIRGLLINVEGSSIKIEPNHVIRGTVFEVETRSLMPGAVKFFEEELDFPILSIPDLYGGKICAALDRQHPRDLFDVMLMQESFGFTEKIKQAFLVYVLSHPRPIVEILNPNKLNLKTIFDKEFRNMTERVVKVEELELIRKQIIKTVIESLTEQDKEFLLSVKSGEPKWELHPCPHIKELPAVRWKLQNIIQMEKTKRLEALSKLKSFLYEKDG
jgi:predicted nucleotidyltransferase component of viral defense system